MLRQIRKCFQDGNKKYVCEDRLENVFRTEIRKMYLGQIRKCFKDVNQKDYMGQIRNCLKDVNKKDVQ